MNIKNAAALLMVSLLSSGCGTLNTVLRLISACCTPRRTPRAG